MHPAEHEHLPGLPLFILKSIRDVPEVDAFILAIFIAGQSMSRTLYQAEKLGQAVEEIQNLRREKEEEGFGIVPKYSRHR